MQIVYRSITTSLPHHCRAVAGAGHRALTRCDHHGHLAAFHFWELFHLGHSFQVIAHPFKDFQAQI